jgi:hypothetical protein
VERTLAALVRAVAIGSKEPMQKTLAPEASVDAANRVAEVYLSDAEAWAFENPDTELGQALLKKVMAGEAQAAKNPASTEGVNVVRFRNALRHLIAWHDANNLPWGDLYLRYDGKSQNFSVYERMTTANPNALELLVDYKTGETTTLKDWVNNYLSHVADNWQKTETFADETEFFRDNVLTLSPLANVSRVDPVTGQRTLDAVTGVEDAVRDSRGNALLADRETAGNGNALRLRREPLLRASSTKGNLYVTGAHLTRLGYALAEAQHAPRPDNDFQAFNLGRTALLAHAELVVNTPELLDKNIARSSKKVLTLRQAEAQDAAIQNAKLAREEREGEPNTLGSSPAPSSPEAQAFAQELSALDVVKKEIYDPMYQQVYDANIKMGRKPEAARKIAETAASQALRQHLDQQRDQQRWQDQRDYEGQWDIDSGMAPLDVAEKHQQEAQQEDLERNGRRAQAEVWIGKDSTRATGAPQNLPIRPGGVFGQEGSEAHGLVQRVLKALNLPNTRIHLYTSAQVEAYEAALEARSMTAWHGFVARRERTRVPAAVAFINGEVFLYYDESLTGADLKEVLGHELGHVVFRAMLDSERERNTPLWNRIYQDYLRAETRERFMEWFANEVGRWVNQREARITKPKEAFMKRVVDAVRDLLRALGLAPTKGAVAAYLDGLALREQQRAYEGFLNAVTGKPSYDALTLQMAYHSRGAERLFMPSNELDFITLDGVKQGSLRQIDRVMTAVPLLRQSWGVTKDLAQWVGDSFGTLNNWMREQGLAELTMHADVLDRGARQAVVSFSSDEDIQALAAHPSWADQDPAMNRRRIDGLIQRARELRAQDWVAGVKLVHFIDARTNERRAEVRPIPKESFSAALQRLYQGQWGSSDEGYRKLTHGKTEAELKAVGEELLRNDPQSATAQALKAWLDGFYENYVVPGFTGAHSNTVHIGRREDWGLARYYSPQAVEANLEAFITLLTTDQPGWGKMSESKAREFAFRIINGQAAITEEDLSEAAGLVPKTLPPGAPSKQSREI